MCGQPRLNEFGMYANLYQENSYCPFTHLPGEATLTPTSPVSYSSYAAFQPLLGAEQPEPSNGTCFSELLDSFSAIALTSPSDGYASSGILSGNSPTKEADARLGGLRDPGFRRDFDITMAKIDGFGYSMENRGERGGLTQSIGRLSNFGCERTNYSSSNIGSHPGTFPFWECNQPVSSNCGLDAIAHPNYTEGYGNLSGTLIGRVPTEPCTPIRIPESKCVSFFDKAFVTDDLNKSSSINHLTCYPKFAERSRKEDDLLKFILPSGPRKNGEGVHDENQGIMETKVINGSSVLMQITLLVSGFIIGPSGETVRSIISKTGASIYSFSDEINGKKCRLFYIDGTVPAICHAIEIIEAAINIYKRLAEGLCNGVQVEKKQRIMGVDFVYQPPPKRRVPYAAGLKVPMNHQKVGKLSHTAMVR